MPIPLAGNPTDWQHGDFVSPDSILSHAKGALLPFFTTMDATVLRALCKEFKEAVTEHKWRDKDTKIKSRVGSWRACFPAAEAANVSGDIDRNGKVTNKDFLHFVGLKSLNMSLCDKVTDAAFVHLKGIHTLDMSWCNRRTITDAAFVHLKGIHTLDMSRCNQDTITDTAFVNLKGIHTLYMSGCNQPTITDAAFVHLKGIHTLDMSWCNQPTITDAAFVHLRGTRILR